MDDQRMIASPGRRRRAAGSRWRRPFVVERIVVARTRVFADPSLLDGVRSFVWRNGLPSGLGGEDLNDLVLAVVEAVATVHLPAGAKERGPVRLTLARGRRDLAVVLETGGPPFKLAAIETDERLATGTRGGMGMFLIRNLVDALHAHHDGVTNRLVLVRASRPID